MFVKLIIIFVIIFQYISGSPLEIAQSQYDVKEFPGRIVGGDDAPEGHANYMVALISGSLIKNLVCGGSIMSPRHILTAAHCIEPFVIWGELSSELQGVIGSNYWNHSNIVKFKDYIIHPGWAWSTLKNDIGVLITTDEMVFSDRVGAISFNYDLIGGGVENFVTGWGRIGVWDIVPDRLQLLYVKTISSEECVEGVRQASETWGDVPPVDTDLEICTLHSRGHGMCNGDSGSALVLKGSRQQVGIVSWGFPCALGAPDVFVRISSFRVFLGEVLNKSVD